NLRFHWKNETQENRNIEDYSVSFIRLGSNIPTFQLDRNVLEAHLLKVNAENPRYDLAAGVRDLDVDLNESGDHRVRFDGHEVACDWIVDSSGRGAFLKRRLSLAQDNSIQHGSTWCWVDGLVDIEKLSGRSINDRIYDPNRRQT